MEHLESVLQQTIQFLRASEDSNWSRFTIAEIIQHLEEEIEKIKTSQPIDKNRLSFLFAPTGSIQAISISNGWGQGFLELSSVIDKCNNSVTG